MQNTIETINKHTYLNYPEQQLVKEIIHKLPASYPVVSRIILYGSKARGDFLEESDIDILLVTERVLSRKERFEIYDLIFELEVKNGIAVSVIFVNLSDFETKNTAFLKQINKEGILLWSKE